MDVVFVALIKLYKPYLKDYIPPCKKTDKSFTADKSRKFQAIRDDLMKSEYFDTAIVINVSNYFKILSCCLNLLFM